MHGGPRAMSPSDSELSAFRHRDPRVHTASASVTSPFHAGHSQLLSILSSFTQKSLGIFSSVQPLSSVRVFATPWTAARQASLSFTISWSLLKLMSIELMMLSHHLILCHPLLLLPSIFPASRTFHMSWPFASGGQNIGV